MFGSSSTTRTRWEGALPLSMAVSITTLPVRFLRGRRGRRRPPCRCSGPSSMTVCEPVRPSCGPPMPVLPSASTQRMRPSATACFSQATLTSLSRPEKPPMPATSAPESMIAEAARRLARDADRAAAVGLHVGEGGGEGGRVAAEHAASGVPPAPALPGAPPFGAAPPGRDAGGVAPRTPARRAARSAEPAGASPGRRRGTCRWWRGRASAAAQVAGAASRPASATPSAIVRTRFEDSATIATTATMPVAMISAVAQPGRARRVVEHDQLDDAADHDRDRGEPQRRALAAQELARRRRRPARP